MPRLRATRQGRSGFLDGLDRAGVDADAAVDADVRVNLELAVAFLDGLGGQASTQLPQDVH